MNIREEYRRAFEAIVPAPALVADTERKANEMRMKLNKKATRRASTLLVAAILFVLLAGVAVAATIHSGILDDLFVYGEPTEAAQEAVVQGGDSASDQGLTLAVTEYLMDGNEFHMAWSVSSEREEPVYYLTSCDFDDGADPALRPIGGYSSGEVGDATLVQLTPERASYSGSMGTGYVRTPGVPVTATVHIQAFTSKLAPVELEPEEYAALREPEDGDLGALEAMIERNEIPVMKPVGWCSLEGYPAFEAAEEKLNSEFDPERDDADEYLDGLDARAMADSGLMEPLTELSVTVSLPAQTSDPAKGASIGESEFELPDRRVVIREFSMDVASTVLRYDIYPKDESGLNFDGYWSDGWTYLLVDPEGKVMNVELSLSMSASANYETRKAGEPLCITVNCDGGPVAEIPEYVTFVPTCALERREGESSFDYYQRMAEQADPANCFTVSSADSHMLPRMGDGLLTP